MNIEERNSLVVQYMPLAYKICKNIWLQQRPRCRNSLADIVQEGRIGLIKAANGFDSSNGAKFITYAYRCIFNAAIDAAKDKSVIKVPRYVANTCSVILPRLSKKKADIYRHADRAMNIMSIDRECDSTERKEIVNGRAESYKNLILFRDDDCHKEFISTDDIVSAINSGILNDKERMVLSLRFYQNLTYTEISSRFGVSPEASRRCCVKAVDKIRNSFGVKVCK